MWPGGEECLEECRPEGGIRQRQGGELNQVTAWDIPGPPACQLWLEEKVQAQGECVVNNQRGIWALLWRLYAQCQQA